MHRQRVLCSGNCSVAILIGDWRADSSGWMTSNASLRSRCLGHSIAPARTPRCCRCVVREVPGVSQGPKA